MTGRRAAAVLVAAGVAAFAAVPATAGTQKKPPKRVVKVGDDFFSPAKMKVPRRTVVVWKWLRANGNTHDVKLRRRPKGVRRFQSEPATAGYRFRRKLRKRGRYKIICTYHRTIMRQTIVVK